MELPAVIQVKVIDTPPTDGRGESPRKPFAQHRSGGYEHGLAVQSQGVMVWIDGKAVWLFVPALTDLRIRGKASQRFESFGKVISHHLRRVIPFTALPVAAMGTGILRFQVRRHLLLHDDLLQAFEDRFTFSEREAQRGGREVLPLHASDLPCLSSGR